MDWLGMALATVVRAAGAGGGGMAVWRLAAGSLAVGGAAGRW